MTRNARPIEFEILKRDSKHGPRFYYHIEGGNHEITNPSKPYDTFSQARVACEGVWFAFGRALCGLQSLQRKEFFGHMPVPYTSNSYKPTKGPKAR